MRIFYDNKEILAGLAKIRSNERGALINLDLIEKQELENWDESFSDKSIFIASEHKGICKKFAEEGRCIIVFDSFLSDQAKKIISGFKNVLLVGARNLSQEDIIFLDENKVRRVEMNQLLINTEETTDSIMEFSFGKDLLVSFNLNFLDSAYASEGSIGGVSAREAIYLLGRIGLMKNLKAFVFLGKDSKLLAKLASELF